MSAYSVTIGVVDPKYEKQARAAIRTSGANGATWLFARGTNYSHWMCLLGLDSPRKEMLLVVHNKSVGEVLLKELYKNCYMDKHGGIAFTMPIGHLHGLAKGTDDACEIVTKKGGSEMQQELIIVIVDNGRGEDVVEAAQKAGARGATLLHGKGSGAGQIEKFFNFEIEPEKELALFVTPVDEVDTIIAGIQKEIDFNKPNTGILFTIDITNSVGLNTNH